MALSPEANTAQSAAKFSLVATTIVVAVKLVAAYLSGSIGVLGEALQSTVDIAMSALAVAAVRYAAKPADREHPYGHGKAEQLAGAMQMLVVILTSAYVMYRAWERFSHPDPIRWDIGAIAMAYTLLSNTYVAAKLKRLAAQTGSASLESEASHLTGDSIMSGGVLVGMLLVGATKAPWVDPAAAIITAVLGIALAWSQLTHLIHPLMDGALPEASVKRLETILDEHSEVRGYHNLRTRAVGAKRFIDLHVLLDDHLTFVAAHDLAETIEDELRVALNGAVVNIHYEPYEAETKHREAAHPEAK